MPLPVHHDRHFLAIFVDQCTLFALYNNKKMILMIIKVYGAEICVSMARSGGVPSGLSFSGDFLPIFSHFGRSADFLRERELITRPIRPTMRPHDEEMIV